MSVLILQQKRKHKINREKNHHFGCYWESCLPLKSSLLQLPQLLLSLESGRLLLGDVACIRCDLSVLEGPKPLGPFCGSESTGKSSFRLYI